MLFANTRFEKVASSKYAVHILAVLLSSLFSILSIYQNPLLNPDAFGYLRAAEIYTTSGIQPVLDNYGWYGYSIIIAIMNFILPVDLLTSAYLFNILSYALLTWSFITLCQEYRNTLNVKLFAAAVILLFPLINEIRYYLVRDFAYWAFAVLALVYLIRFQKSGQLVYAASCCCALLAATFFRLEGILLFLASPIALLFTSSSTPQNAASGLQKFAQLVGIVTAGLLLIFSLCLLAGINLVDLIAYAYRYYLPGIYNLGEVLLGTADDLNQAIFTPTNFPGNSSHGLAVLLIAYLYTVLINLINALSIPVSCLLIYGCLFKSPELEKNCRPPLFAFAIASFLALLVFMFIMHFLTQRYAALLSILLLSLAPVILDDLYKSALLKSRISAFKRTAALFVCYFFLDSMVSFGYSKDYIEDSIQWLNTNLPANADLQTNLHAIAFFSEKIPDYDKISLLAEDSIQAADSGDYIVLDLRVGDLTLRETLDQNPKLALLQSFANGRNDEIRIYQMQ